MLLSNPQSPSQNPHHLRPKNPRCRPAPPSSRRASSERYNRRVAEPASIVAFLPYLPATRCRFVIVEPAVPLPSLGATILRHLPVEPTAAVVFSWSQYNGQHCHQPSRPWPSPRFLWLLLIGSSTPLQLIDFNRF
uniref:Uncharacterized protein n=1 Tax=Oryza rufipogon TaxID=4529 RepID=A0A0E0P7H5_ORYRU